ncbi:tRNA-splicing endonuclease subunit Sen34 isoform X2 [Bombina bombina]|uniref:tRNA-splicing endonuclease subunit Sen34 isoform X2 n=1 Tax=Bombina bombina TaxID=8345 RepID=UPI00235AE61B|nr:tRNA-splicing endonuclease subunit Sen34 isoform X2 [Bombina bombina]
MILIHLLEGKAFVWNAEDAKEIREQHCIVGNLVGALVRKPRQNTRLGLPLQLLPEETRLLVEIGAAKLVHSCSDEKITQEEHDIPMPSLGSCSESEDKECLRSQIEAYNQHLEESYKEQCRLALQEKRRTLESLADRIAEGRTKRKRQRGKQAEEMSSTAKGPIKELQNLEENFHFPQEAMMVQISTARTTPGKVEEVDLNLASTEWPYAGQETHELHYKVFRDLWQRGYFLTSGSKFGGDYLVYPGDPMRFHAHYIAICFPNNKEIPLTDIITAGRLGTNVKKTILICSTNQEGLVNYTSLQWSGLQ